MTAEMPDHEMPKFHTEKTSVGEKNAVLLGCAKSPVCLLGIMLDWSKHTLAMEELSRRNYMSGTCDAVMAPLGNNLKIGAPEGKMSMSGGLRSCEGCNSAGDSLVTSTYEMMPRSGRPCVLCTVMVSTFDPDCKAEVTRCERAGENTMVPVGALLRNPVTTCCASEHMGW